MTLQTLYNIILKVMGILLLKKILDTFGEVIPYLFVYEQYDYTAAVLISIFNLLLYGFLFVLLVFRTDSIIKRLNLVPKAKEAEFSFSIKDPVSQDIDATFIIKLALITTGIYILIYEVPSFIHQLAMYYQQSRMYAGDEATPTHLFLSAAKILVAYIIIQAHATIAALAVKTAKTSE